MAFTDSGDDSPMGNAGPGASDTGPGGPEGSAPGMMPPPQGGPILAALSRQAQGPQVSAPGPGNMADSLGKIKTAIDLLQSAQMGLPTGSRQHSDVLRAVQALSKHLPQMGPQSGLQKTHLMDLLRRQGQNPVLQALQGMIGGGPGGGQGGGPGGAQGPQPPMPSTPLPGA